MPGRDMLIAIDEEIARLQMIRELMTEEGGKRSPAATASKLKRKKQDVKATSVKRVLSPEARDRIAAAQRKRWAASKRAAKRAGK